MEYRILVNLHAKGPISGYQTMTTRERFAS